MRAATELESGGRRCAAVSAARRARVLLGHCGPHPAPHSLVRPEVAPVAGVDAQHPVRPLTPALSGEALDELSACCEVSTDAVDRRNHGTERSGHATPGIPSVVAYPKSTEEVQAIMRICHKRRLPVVAYGAGSSLEGHTVNSGGGVTMDMSLMDKIVAVHEEDMDCVVQPGLNWQLLNKALEPMGLFLGVDPGPSACIGGMCATRCSGTKALVYGTMAAQVLSLRVVLADGTLVSTGRRARKSSAGYDLARLFVGSEGTLGVVVEATLRLRRAAPVSSVARVGFDTVRDAAAAVAELVRQGVPLAAAELMDAEMVRAVNASAATSTGGGGGGGAGGAGGGPTPFPPLPDKPTLLLKFSGSEAHVRDDVDRARQIASRFSSSPFYFSRNKEEEDALWHARKVCLWAAMAQRPGRQLMTTDVCVPISRMADVIMASQQEIARSPLYAPIVSHVGDGNFHACIMYDPAVPAEANEAHRLHAFMVGLALAADGTCTGEHGVGCGKIAFLEEEVGMPAIDLMRSIKRALDPRNILNPGKVFTMPPPPAAALLQQ